jgi:hypothetical protein
VPPPPLERLDFFPILPDGLSIVLNASLSLASVGQTQKISVAVTGMPGGRRRNCESTTIQLSRYGDMQLLTGDCHYHIDVQMEGMKYGD